MGTQDSLARILSVGEAEKLPEQQFPQGWEVTSLKYVINSMHSGGTPATSNDNYWEKSEGGIPWVTISDMSGDNQYVTNTEKNVSQAGIEAASLRILPEDTLLFAMYASLGETAILNTEAVTNQAILALIPNENYCVQEYLNIYLQSLQPYLPALSASNTQNNLSAERVKNIPIILPPIPIQQRIVSFLNYHTTRIDALIERSQKLLKLQDEKRSAVIHRAITGEFHEGTELKKTGVPWINEIPESWALKPIRAVVDRRREENSPVRETHMLSVVRGKGVISYENRSASGNKASDDLEKYQIVHKDDIVANRLNLLIGSSGIARKKGICSPEYYVLKPKKSEAYPDYIRYIFVDSRFLKWLSRYGKGIKNLRERVYYQDLRTEHIPIPPRDEQIEIVKKLDDELDQIDNIKEKLLALISLLKERRRALITKTVTGKLNLSENESQEGQELPV